MDMSLFREKKNYYAPRRWNLKKILTAINSIATTLKKKEKFSKEWYILQVKREIYALKKHIIFLEQIVGRYEGKD